MKKTIITTALLGLFSTSILGVVANAAPEPLPHSKDTISKIQFTVDDEEEGYIIKPNPDKETPDEHDYIVPEGGNKSKGPLRIQFVPDLNFGIKKGLSSSQITAAVKPIAYQPATDIPEGADNSHTTAGFIAPFVQVTDNRGLSNPEFANKKGWKLTVSATEFATKGATPDVLTGSKISLRDSTLTTTNGSQEDAKKLVSGIKASDINAAGDSIIPLTGGALVVLETLPGESANTNGHQVSNVFGKEYKKTDEPAANADLAGVKFIKPAGKAPIANVDYVSTLTWTLTDGF